jgi:hypothetical protein
MAWFKAKVLPATVSFELKKVPKERMVNRAKLIAQALTQPASADKKSALAAELKNILKELGAREDALSNILSDPRFKD